MKNRLNLTSPNNLHIRYNTEATAGYAEVDVRFAEGAQWRPLGTYFDRSTARKAARRVATQVGRKAIVTHRPDGAPIAKLYLETSTYAVCG